MKNDKLYLQHILDCICKIEEYTIDGEDVFLNDEMTSDAVLRKLQIMAESTQKLSDEIKNKYPEIKWDELSGFRNILTHAYFDINLNRVWNSVVIDIPVLKEFAILALRELEN